MMSQQINEIQSYAESKLLWIVTVQVPPFWQGCVAHSSTSDSQRAPEYPGAHPQLKLVPRSFIQRI